MGIIRNVLTAVSTNTAPNTTTVERIGGNIDTTIAAGAVLVGSVAMLVATAPIRGCVSAVTDTEGAIETLIRTCSKEHKLKKQIKELGGKPL